MIDNQEITPQQPPNGNRLPDVSILPAPEPAVSPFVSRIQELKAASQVSLQRVNFLLNDEPTVLPPQEGENSQVDASALLRELTGPEVLPPADYIQKSKRALRESIQLIDHLRGEVYWSQIEGYEGVETEEIEERQTRIAEINSTRGPKKLLAIFEKKRLGREITAIEKERTARKPTIEAKIDQLTQQRTQLEEQERQVRQKQEELLTAEICREIQTVKSGYEQFLQDIITDGTIPSEIIGLRVEREIAPCMENEIGKGGRAEDDREEFYRVLRNYLEHRDSPYPERQQYEDELMRRDGVISKFQVAVEASYSLVSYNKERKIIQQLVAALAAETVAPIKNAALSNYASYFRKEANERFFEAYDKVIGTSQTNEDLSPTPISFSRSLSLAVDQQQNEALFPHATEWSGQLFQSDLWQAVRDSPSANQIFGEVIATQDQQYCQYLIDGSLKWGGSYVSEATRFYHSPEVIRNAVLFAVANDYGDNSYARYGLRLLSQRPDWEEILDEAEQTYPLLKNARQVLTSSDFYDGDRFQLQEVAKSFVLDFYENNASDTYLHKLALKGLTNDSIISLLAKRGILPEEEAVVLTKAVSFTAENSEYEYLRTHSQMVSQILSKEITIEEAIAENMLSKGDTIVLKKAIAFAEKSESLDFFVQNPVGFTLFENELRKSLSRLLEPAASDQANEANREVAKKLQALSAAIIENKTNLPALSYLTNRLVIERLEEPFKAEDFLIFLKAYQSCPGLLTNQNLFSYFCSQFEGEQSIAFYNNLTGAYKGLNEPLNRVLALVISGELTKERALELPAKAMDLLLSHGEHSFLYKHPHLFLETDDGIMFFSNLIDAYKGRDELLTRVVSLVSNGELTKERVLELPDKAKEIFALPSNSRSLVFSFPKLFLENDDGIAFVENMSKAYQGPGNPFYRVLGLVSRGELTKERALELPTKAMNLLPTQDGPTLPYNYPHLFLETDEGLSFLTHLMNQGNLFSLEKGLEARFGERVTFLQRKGNLNFLELLKGIYSPKIYQLDKSLASGTSIDIQPQNWQQLLMGYVQSQAENDEFFTLSPTSSEKIKKLFEDPNVRDLCLNGLNDAWIAYLKSGKKEAIPFSLIFMSEFINQCEGAGALSQVESLSSLIRSVNLAFSAETTFEKTKQEVFQGLAGMEERFVREKWSNEDKTDFYNISRDILGAAPSLFSEYLSLFERFSPSQMRTFAKDVYPLYKTKLVLIEKRDYLNNKKYDLKQLIEIRKDIKNFAEVFMQEKAFERRRQALSEEIKNLFKDRFGIIKIPQEFSPEHFRSVINVSTYLANLNGRNPTKETILGFYLSLMINGKWDDFRSGEAIDTSEYMLPGKQIVIDELLRERQRLNPLTAEALGLSESDMPEFLKLLQTETQNLVIGNIETIDIKLTNIILNLRGLEDLDLYPDSLDKKRMHLLLNWGNKKIGSVVARMYQSLANPGRSIQFSEDDTKISQQITQSIRELGLTLTPETLKEHFQDGIKPLATVVNLLNFIEETQAESGVESLREILKPTPEVIEIFKRLGEDFKPTSGAIALSQDLDFLDNLIVKREEDLTPEEKALLVEYTTKIRGQIVGLENIYNQIKNKFLGFKQGSSGQKNPLLQEKLDQIDKIVNAQATQQAITSTTTNNLNSIIENIRACLSCTSSGCNNDTDLTFGDMNKFFIYSQSENQTRRSISDQIVFVEPVTRADGSPEIAFVLDRVYGSITPVILENHIEAILKKYRSIKQKFPNIKLSVFVPAVAVSTGGISMENILELFRSKKIIAEIESVEVNVAESATGDHYIEFGATDARVAGKKQASGIILSL